MTRHQLLRRRTFHLPDVSYFSVGLLTLSSAAPLEVGGVNTCREVVVGNVPPLWSTFSLSETYFSVTDFTSCFYKCQLMFKKKKTVRYYLKRMDFLNWGPGFCATVGLHVTAHSGLWNTIIRAESCASKTQEQEMEVALRLKFTKREPSSLQFFIVWKWTVGLACVLW